MQNRNGPWFDRLLRHSAKETGWACSKHRTETMKSVAVADTV